MCIDFPGRVIAREGDEAIVECDGRRRRASTLLFPDLAVGEWVYVSAGTVFERLDAATAAQVMAELSGARDAAPTRDS
ncbi:MAG TPA: HypC/HybG/HupF family hydrogenase formation chaperone [Candidatus Limnocylindrales bacterium]|jgi:hydrogenase assembly chaperone HypC/HupF